MAALLRFIGACGPTVASPAVVARSFPAVRGTGARNDASTPRLKFRGTLWFMAVSIHQFRTRKTEVCMRNGMFSLLAFALAGIAGCQSADRSADEATALPDGGGGPNRLAT